MLEIDSPGGEVTASDQIYTAVANTRARKPVVIYMDTLAASGGYYISCGGKYLMANETTITGRPSPGDFAGLKSHCPNGSLQ